MKRVDLNEACPKCRAMGDHDKSCPDYPKEWKECKEHVADKSGICVKCGCPCF